MARLKGGRERSRIPKLSSARIHHLERGNFGHKRKAIACTYGLLMGPAGA
jgi:hypothetical protein